MIIFMNKTIPYEAKYECREAQNFVHFGNEKGLFRTAGKNACS